MRGQWQYLVVAIVGGVIGAGIAEWLNANAIFEEFIETDEAERGIILAMHISEEVRLFSETGMKYTLNGALPIALEGGGNPSNEEYKGLPSLDGIRYWKSCVLDETEPACQDRCTYTTLDTSESGLEDLISKGVNYTVGNLLEKYATAFMERQVYLTSIKPVDSQVSVNINGDMNYQTNVETTVFTTQRNVQSYSSRGFVSSIDNYSANNSAPALQGLLSSGVTVLTNLPIDAAATSAGKLTDEDVWKTDVRDYLLTNYDSPSGYTFDTHIIDINDDADCALLTLNVTISTDAPEYWIYRTDSLVQEPLNLTFLVQKMITLP